MAGDNGVERTLGKILATQELILKQLERHNSALDEHIREDKLIEKRLDRIENRFAYASGTLAAFVVVLSLLSDTILTKLGLK